MEGGQAPPPSPYFRDNINGTNINASLENYINNNNSSNKIPNNQLNNNINKNLITMKKMR